MRHNSHTIYCLFLALLVKLGLFVLLLILLLSLLCAVLVPQCRVIPHSDRLGMLYIILSRHIPHTLATPPDSGSISLYQVICYLLNISWLFLCQVLV